MKSPADIIVELESDNSRLFKESVIIREMESNNKEFFEGVKYACDKLITFGVANKSIPDQTNFDLTTDTITFSEFKEYLTKLINREITGNAAKDLLEYISDNTTSFVWNNWFRRILLKDLKCGVSETTINNCAKKTKIQEYSIPVFSCQLAQDSGDHKSKMVGEKIIQSKLDGSRVLTILYPDGRVDQFSRNGKEVLNFQHIKDQFSKVAESITEPMVFDGEIMSASFQDLMTQFYRKENVDTSDSILNLFDMIPLEDFQNGIYKIKQINRLEALDNWFVKGVDVLNNVNVLGYEIINLNDSYGQEKFSALNKKALENGFEGVMIKDLNAPYECKRSSSWLKMKPVKSIDLTIISMEEGTDKYTGMLGALVCTGNDSGNEILVNVGTGLSDEQRKNFWDFKDDAIGKIAEIEYDVITKNLLGSYSLRFPRFVRLRGFEKGEKI